jgi:oligoendopeptidase F
VPLRFGKNYIINGNRAVEQYKDALKLGYTKSIGEIYQTAGIQFDFSKEYVRDLAHFVKNELLAIG